MNNSGETRLVVKRNHGKGGTCYLSALSPQDLSEIPEYRVDLPFWNPLDQSITYSCSGGLLAMSDFAGHIYLCNPTTKQFQIFPPKETPYGTPSLSMTRIIGSCVGYDSESDDYRILKVWEREHCFGIGQPSQKHRTYELYSLRNDSWKEIPAPKYGRLSGMTPKIIYARGKFYWPTLDLTVMSLDCSTESFSLLPSPPNTRGLLLQPVKFYDQDSLGVVLHRRRNAYRKTRPGSGIKPDFYFELWIWRDGARCWDRVFNVNIGGSINGTEGAIYGQFVFVQGAAGSLKDVKERLVAYDWGKKECKELGIHNYYVGINVFCYVESTVALPHGKPIYGSHIIDYGYFDKDEEANMSDDDSFDNEVLKADLKDFEDNGFRIIDEIELEVEEKEVRTITNGSMPSSYHTPNYGYGQSPIYQYNPYIPNYGYGQSPFYPCNPYIPGAMIGADRSIIAPQHYYTLPLYENPVTWASYPPLIFQTRPAGDNVGLNTPSSSLTAMGDASGAKILSEGRVNTITSGSNSITSQAAPIPQIRGPQGMQNSLRGKALAVSSQLKTAFTCGNGSSSFELSNYSHASVNNVKPNMLSGRAPNDERVGPDILHDQNRESRTRKQLVVNACTTRAGNPDAQGNIIIPGGECNRVDFPVEYANAKFFVIKSHSEDDVHKSIKYSLWSSTPNGNKKLNDVNATGQFCGIAEMTGPVDCHRDIDFWLRDKRSGSFPVKWHIIKDLSNLNFRHIILENNENTPVTNSIDIQEISFKKGLEMLKIFKRHMSKTSPLENRQFNLQGEREARLHSVDELKLVD